MDRPALAAVFPTAIGTAASLLDVGANVDCKPHNLEQFAVMGEIYFRSMFGTERPRVGLLSIGEEESKGNELTREAFQLLQAASAEFCRQRRRPRSLQRQSRCHRRRRIRRQCCVEDFRRRGQPGAFHAERNFEGDHHAPGGSICSRAAHSPISRSVSTTRSTAARRCWG